MPLPPLPDNNTVRVWIKYTSVGTVHEFMFRLPETAGVTDAESVANDVADVLALRMSNTDSLLSARWSPAGSAFSVPIAFTSRTGTLTQSTWAQDPESTELAMTGRSFDDGRKVAWYFFTGQQTTGWPADNRYNPGESGVIDTFRINFAGIISGASSPERQIVTISGTIPSVNAYVNIRQNGYWQSAQR